MDNRTTVIIADNAEDFCSSLTAALQRAEGFQVLGTANDGEQAIRLVTEKKPDVLVLDLMLAKKDGLSVLKALSATERRPVTLATSRFVTDYVASAAANLGVRYLMLKPCDMTALVERLELPCVVKPKPRWNFDTEIPAPNFIITPPLTLP